MTPSIATAAAAPSSSLVNTPPPLGADSPSDEDADPAVRVDATASPHPPLLPLDRDSTKTPGHVLLIYGLPDLFTVGCDALSFTVDHNFAGICHVTPGPHLFWVAHPGGTSARAGVFIVVSGDDHDATVPSNVHAFRWDPGTELLQDMPPPSSEQQQQQQQWTPLADDIVPRHKLHSYLDLMASSTSSTHATEPQDIWSQLTSFITPALLSRVTAQTAPTPAGCASWHLHTTDHVRGEMLSSAERELDEQRRRYMSCYLGRNHRPPSPPPARELRFALDQATKTYSAQQFGADRTLEATDSTSYILSRLGQQDHDGDDGGSSNKNDKDNTNTITITEADLVGELQLAFLVGVHLGNDACLEQWWHMLLHLVLKAYTLPLARPRLVASWLRALVAQLIYGGGGGDGDWLDTPITELSSDPRRGRALRLALIIYKRRLDELLLSHGGGNRAIDTCATTTTMTTTTMIPEQQAVAVVAMAFSRLEAVVGGSAFGWDLAADNYLRRGKVVLDDGDELDELELKELQAEDERGEWAPVVVELDEYGRQMDCISWHD